MRYEKDSRSQRFNTSMTSGTEESQIFHFFVEKGWKIVCATYLRQTPAKEDLGHTIRIQKH